MHMHRFQPVNRDSLRSGGGGHRAVGPGRHSAAFWAGKRWRWRSGAAPPLKNCCFAIPFFTFLDSATS